MSSRLLPFVACAALALPASAGSLDALHDLTQSEFRDLSGDLGAALSYKGVTPATPLGPLGFDVGLEVTGTHFEHAGLLARAGAGNTSDVLIPKLHLYKGLVGGLDLGGFVARASELDATLWGLDLRYALWDDSLARPAAALRLSGTRATGMGDVSLSTLAFDGLVSKRFAALTPYAGAGIVRVSSRASNAALSEETFNRGRAFAGLDVNLFTLNLAFEAEKMGADTSLSAKLGLRF